MLRTWRVECGGPGSLPICGTKIPQVSGHGRGEKDFWFCLYCLYWTESFPGKRKMPKS